MDIDTCVTLSYLFKTKNKIFVFFFLHFFNPSAQTIKAIDLLFFNELALKNWAMNVHLNHISIL